jgi:hypothetical protein
MKQFLFALVAILVVALGPPAFGETMPVLDVSHPDSDGGNRFFATRQLCQTFECGMNGDLVKISMSFSTLSDELAPATVSVVGTTVEGMPDDADVLWTQDFPNGFAQGWVDVDLSASPPHLQAGEAYGIVWKSPDAVYGSPDDVLDTDFSSDYVDGRLWENRGSGWQTLTFNGVAQPNADATFKTWMVVPEPSAIALLIMLTLPILGKRHI